MNQICKEAGLVGKYTNYSLCATSASRMYENAVPQQVIKEVTGRKSECVRVYKHTSDSIREHVSNTISGKKCVKQDQKVLNVTQSESSNVETEGDKTRKDPIKKLSERDRDSMSVCDMIKNVIKTKMEIRNTKKCVNKLAKRIVKKEKKTVIKRLKSEGIDGNKRFIIDLNVNLNVTK